MSKSSFYAGYGTNYDPVMVEAIIGEKPDLIDTVYILESGLWVQRMDQTPDIPLGEGPLTVHQLLIGNWGPDGEAHGLRKSVGGIVLASLFEVSPLHLELIANWELVPDWKERETLTVRRMSNDEELPALTELLPANQPTDRVVNGQDYDIYLRNPDDLYRAAEAARLDYLATRKSD